MEIKERWKLIYKGNGWVHFPSPLNSFSIKGTCVHGLFHWNGTETSKIFGAWLFTAQRLSTENRYLLAIFLCTSGKWKHLSNLSFTNFCFCGRVSSSMELHKQALKRRLFDFQLWNFSFISSIEPLLGPSCVEVFLTGIPSVVNSWRQYQVLSL